jgi:hypothetical protein
MGTLEPYFWRNRRLSDLSRDEWEALCDGCGRCCLVKLEDEDTGELHHTNVACRLFDAGQCRCTKYERRHALVHDCVPLTPENIGDIKWLPPSCAYRLVDEGRDLAWWHPLVSGTADTVREAGASVHGRTLREQDVDEYDLEDHCVTWPALWPDRDGDT